MDIKYRPEGVCSRLIEIELDDNGVIGGVKFTGGCNGNLQGISRLVRGMTADEAIERLSGIRCGMKGTSCPDQFARALKEYKKQQATRG